MEFSSIAGESVSWYNHFGELFHSLYYSWKYTHHIMQQFHSEGVYLKEMHVFVHQNTYTRIFRTALFVVLKLETTQMHITVELRLLALSIRTLKAM